MVSHPDNQSDSLPNPVMNKLAREAWQNLDIARNHAKMAFDTARHENGEQAKRERKNARRDLKRLKKALLNLCDEAFYALEVAETNTEIQFKQNELLALIEAAEKISTGDRGNNQLAPYHAAADYLLEHYRVTSGEPTATQNDSRKHDEIVTSKAIQFLDKEFKRLGDPYVDYRQRARTIINKWRRSRQIT